MATCGKVSLYTGQRQIQTGVCSATTMSWDRSTNTSQPKGLIQPRKKSSYEVHIYFSFCCYINKLPRYIHYHYSGHLCCSNRILLLSHILSLPVSDNSIQFFPSSMFLTHKKKRGREQEIRVSTRVIPYPWKIGRKLLHHINKNKQEKMD